MPNILAIDTSSSSCTVAVLVAGKLASRTLDSDRHNAQQALHLLTDVLKDGEVTLQQISVIAVMAGPGSFTGIRIGVGIAQGLSMAHGTPVLPLSILAVKAFAVMRSSGCTRVLVSDSARNDEIYFAAYEQCPLAGVRLLGSEQVGTVADIVFDKECTDSGDRWLAAGNGWQALPAMRQQLGVAIELSRIDPEFTSEDLCELARLQFLLGMAVPAEQALPNYVKDTLHYLAHSTASDSPGDSPTSALQNRTIRKQT